MSIRYPQLLLSLLTIALLMSLAPVRWQTSAANSFNWILFPVLWPIQFISPPIRPSTTRPSVARDASVADLEEQIDRLRQDVIYLQSQIDNHERDLLAQQEGERSSSIRVIGITGTGRGLLRLAPSRVLVQVDDIAFSEIGLVGRVIQVAPGNQATVRTITDKGFLLTAEFVRVTSKENTRIALEPRVIEGMGASTNEMVVNGISTDEVKKSGLAVGDWVNLQNDPSSAHWPPYALGKRVGIVSFIGEKVSDVPGQAEVRIKPTGDLMSLKTVWIGRAAQ